MDIPELAATRSSVVGQRLLVWTGPLLMVVFFLGFWVISGFLPPPSPMRTPNQVVAFFINHTGQKRIGLFLVGFAGALSAPGVRPSADSSNGSRATSRRNLGQQQAMTQAGNK